MSLKEGIVPFEWKEANIIPLFKKGSRNKSVNYRPVSLTSVICKLLETIIRDHMMDFLIKHKLINPSQHGFPLDASVHLNISADEHLPAGADYPWTTWKALNRLRTQVGRSRVNMSKWGYSNETETCDCGIRQTMQHLLVCPMMNTACSPQDLTTANDIAIGCARHWEGTI